MQHRILLISLMLLACPEGLEPPTYCLEGNCSIQLSYGQFVLALGSREAYEAEDGRLVCLSINLSIGLPCADG